MKPTVRILIADDHELIRRGLRGLLENQAGWQVIAEAADGRQAVEKAKQLRPDMVILDVSMPNLNGLEAARHIRKALPETEILILTMHENNQLVREVVECGARGYILKSDAGRDLVSAVEALRQHGTFFTSRVAKVILNGYLTASSAAPPTEISGLSDREREIIQLIAEGKGNKEMAAVLGISIKTVETHRKNLMQKLHLSSAIDVVRWALRNGVIEL